MDCVRELGPDHIVHWYETAYTKIITKAVLQLDCSIRPTPTIDELQDSIKQFCSMHWGGDGSHLMGRHKFTSDEKLPYRCLESVYIVTLLEFGFGFHGSHRNITLANEVNVTPKCRFVQLFINNLSRSRELKWNGLLGMR